jgi:hypothetical protein
MSVGLANNQAKRATVRVIRPDESAYLLPLVMPPSPEGVEPNPITVSRVGQFPEKVITGDFTRFSHPWLSGFVQHDWSGGGQIRDSQEATDISRYWDGTLESRFPHSLSLPPYVGTIELEGNSDPVIMLGDIRHAGTTRFLVAFGTSLQSVSTTFTLTDLGTLPVTPTGAGIAFRGDADNKRLFIPCGSSGYLVFDPDDDSISGPHTDVEPLNFVEWNRNIWTVDAEGEVFYNNTGEPADWTSKLRIDGEGDARSIGRYYDQNGMPNLFVVTDRDLQQISIADGESYVTSLEYAPHPDAARVATRWREWFAVSYGVDLARYDGGTISYVGLSRDHGLPAELRGSIRAAAPAWNDLFVLLEGAQVEGESGGSLEIDTYGDMLLTQTSALSSVMRLDSLGGWHPLWRSDTVGQSVTNIYVHAGSADGDYAVFWGFGGKVYYSPLPQQFQNPAENPTARFAKRGYLISPWLDFNLTGLDLILASGDIRHENCSANRVIRLSYQIDDDDESDTWRELPEINTQPSRRGSTRFRFGHNFVLPNGQTHYTGQVLTRVRYKVEIIVTSDDEYTTVSPLIDSTTIAYMPKMSTFLSWNFSIDCTCGDFNGLSNLERQELCNQLIEDEFVAFNYRGDEWLSVKFSGAGGVHESNRFAGDYEITAVATEEMKL